MSQHVFYSISFTNSTRLLSAIILIKKMILNIEKQGEIEVSTLYNIPCERTKTFIKRKKKKSKCLCIIKNTIKKCVLLSLFNSKW